MCADRDADFPKETSRKAGPKHVGTWIMACTADGEIMKWGLDGDTEFPYPPEDKKEVEAQLRYLNESADSGLCLDDRLYVLHIFENGQMKQYEYDRKH